MDAIRVPIEDDKGYLVRIRFQEFLQSYGKQNDDQENAKEITQQMILENYMLQIEHMIHMNKSTVFVNFAHVKEVDAELAEAIEFDYYRFEPYLRHAVHTIVAQENQNFVYDVDKGQREFFVAFYNLPIVEKIRSVRTAKIGRLISISGTVTRTSEVRPELFYGHFLCKKCGSVHPAIEQQFQYTEPPVCKNPQCGQKNNFQLVVEKSLFIDWQRLRVQENADEIPAGSMPRCLEVICRNEVVEIAKAGDKIVLTGTVAVLPDTSGLSRAGETAMSSKKSGGGDMNDGVQGLKKLGVKEMTYKMIFIASSVQITDQRSGKPSLHQVIPYFADLANDPDRTNISAEIEEIPQFTSQDIDLIKRMYETQNLYSHMAESICPAVFGHLEVKRGILLMLLGGVHKKTMEGISLRGDINVCIVGDPSCAKSQFLKYVHGFLPRTIYTSGKSSSAAGLTASVVRDAETGEFCVEAGALMLADNGICCIDEFDKMDAADQVAIHEAMEQQTISITKAGIQATLNARTSILAAANPVFGRYDKTKTLKANIAISAPIMSRFDLFFIILDECERSSDEKIARHIVSIHKRTGIKQVNTEATFSREELQKYITFARTINPAFTDESQKTLVECYRLLRQNDILGKNKTAYRITVRQLESLIRLSEALARLHLNPTVNEAYVKEAFRLLQKSIIFVESDAVQLDDEMEGEDAMGGISAGDAIMEESLDHRDRPLSEIMQFVESQQLNTDDVMMLQQSTAAPATTEPPPAAVAAAPSKKSKQKTQIPAKEFDDISNLLKLHLKQVEEDHENSGSGDSYLGCKWRDLTDWYLSEYAKKQSVSDLGIEQTKKLSDAEVEQKREVVNKIIKHIIKKGGDIVVVQESSENDQKLLKLHPSYQI